MAVEQSISFLYNTELTVLLICTHTNNERLDVASTRYDGWPFTM